MANNIPDILVDNPNPDKPKHHSKAVLVPSMVIRYKPVVHYMHTKIGVTTDTV